MHIFNKQQLLNLYASDQEARIAHFENLLHQADLQQQEDGGLKAVHSMKGPLQIYKDEPSLTLVTIAALALCGSQVLAGLLIKVFPNANWSADNIKVVLEKAVSPTAEIMESIEREVMSHPVKYAREAAQRKSNWEGPTVFDAIITFPNQVNVFVEAKFTSDISIDTTHRTSRNQIARCIDVGLASVQNDINRFFFLMLTPARYQEDPGNRYYYFKMKQYREDPQTLSLDIPRLEKHIENVDYLNKTSQHIGFLSFDDCANVILSNARWNDREREWLTKFYEDRMLYFDLDKLS